AVEDVTGVHAREESSVQTCVADQLEVLFPLLPALLDRFLEASLHILGTPCTAGQVADDAPQVVDLGLAEHGDLPGLDGARSFGILSRLLLRRLGALAEDLAHDHLRRLFHNGTVKTFRNERLDDKAVEGDARPDREVPEFTQRELALEGSPVTLQTLGGNAGPNRPAEGNTLGKSRVVAVEKGRGVRGQEVNLNETIVHGSSRLLCCIVMRSDGAANPH